MSKTHTRHRSGSRPDRERSETASRETKGVQSRSEQRLAEAREVYAPPGGAFLGRRVGRSSADLGDVLRPIAPDERRAGVPSTARRNALARTSKATHELEDSANGKPSRKSTRRAGKTHIKSDTNLKLRQTRALSSPKSRARSAAAARSRAGSAAAKSAGR